MLGVVACCVTVSHIRILVWRSIRANHSSGFPANTLSLNSNAVCLLTCSRRLACISCFHEMPAELMSFGCWLHAITTSGLQAKLPCRRLQASCSAALARRPTAGSSRTSQFAEFPLARILPLLQSVAPHRS